MATESAAVKPSTIGAWRRVAGPGAADRGVKDEMRATCCASWRRARPLFPGVHGYEETVLPQIVNAILARHNFILLGLRGQAKSRILRGLVEFPRRRKFPTSPAARFTIIRCTRSAAPAGNSSPSSGDDTPIAWLPREDRYVEKLATPDVTIADIIGDVDPIKAARGGRDLSRRADHALRPAAPRQSRHLRHQRTARPRRQNPGGPVQHHAGRRRAD